MSETAKNTPEDLHDVNAEETASEEVAAEATEEELEDAALQDPVEALEAEVAELKDRLLRQAAEVENTRRRAKKTSRMPATTPSPNLPATFWMSATTCVAPLMPPVTRPMPIRQ